MKVLLVGSGGREHALAWRLAQSEHCDELYCAPGNAGIAECAENVDIAAEDVEKITAFAVERKIDLVVVGPEAPLTLGLADMLRAKDILVFGPSRAAARLEGSKAFMKDLCAKYDVPTATYEIFTNIEKAKVFIRKTGTPIVVKTDGLAGGKGVIVAETAADAEKAAEGMLSGSLFGKASSAIVIEEFLDGEELSFFALADGKDYLCLTSAQDHKRVGDGDTGPNTGGMGAYSPAHMMTPALGKQIEDTIIKPTIDGMAADGFPFAGVLFAGIMVVKGVPKLLEFNVRFGDPECQALMMRLEGDLLEILDAAARGVLDSVRDKILWRDDAALCVVMAAKGYPGAYKKDTEIRNIGAADALPDVKVFHAGTKRVPDGRILNFGARALGVTATGATIAEAQKNAYEAVDKIDWPDGFCRRDIGWRAAAERKKKASA